MGTDDNGPAGLVEKAGAFIDDQRGLRPKAQWVPYSGPRGGEGWKNTETGDIEYGEQPPGDAVDPADYVEEITDLPDDPSPQDIEDAAMTAADELGLDDAQLAEDLADTMGIDERGELPDDMTGDEASAAITQAAERQLPGAGESAAPSFEEGQTLDYEGGGEGATATVLARDGDDFMVEFEEASGESVTETVSPEELAEVTSQQSDGEGDSADAGAESLVDSAVFRGVDDVTGSEERTLDAAEAMATVMEDDGEHAGNVSRDDAYEALQDAGFESGEASDITTEVFGMSDNINVVGKPRSSNDPSTDLDGGPEDGDRGDDETPSWVPEGITSDDIDAAMNDASSGDEFVNNLQRDTGYTNIDPATGSQWYADETGGPAVDDGGEGSNTEPPDAMETSVALSEMDEDTQREIAEEYAGGAGVSEDGTIDRTEIASALGREGRAEVAENYGTATAARDGEIKTTPSGSDASQDLRDAMQRSDTTEIQSNIGASGIGPERVAEINDSIDGVMSEPGMDYDDAVWSAMVNNMSPREINEVLEEVGQKAETPEEKASAFIDRQRGLGEDAGDEAAEKAVESFRRNLGIEEKAEPEQEKEESAVDRALGVFRDRLGR